MSFDLTRRFSTLNLANCIKLVNCLKISYENIQSSIYNNHSMYNFQCPFEVLIEAEKIRTS